MISAVSNRGLMRFMLYDGALDIARFLTFLRRLIKDAAQKVFLIVDNLKVHHARRSRPGWRAIATRSSCSTCRPTLPSTTRTNT